MRENKIIKFRIEDPDTGISVEPDSYQFFSADPDLNVI